jgi:hypothetical protein
VKELIKTETVTRNTYLEYIFKAVPTGDPAPALDEGYTDMDLIGTVADLDVYLQSKVVVEIV